MKSGGERLLVVEGLCKSYRAGRVLRRAVDGVSFHLDRGEVLALVGESGSGKSTLVRLVDRLELPDAGTLRWLDDGRELDLLRLSGRPLRQWRRRVGFVFQDPYQSLNPRQRVDEALLEVLRLAYPRELRTTRLERARRLLAEVGLDADCLPRHPHAFSGGQRQRIALARALAGDPCLLLCDEPTSKLDAPVQAQILNLLADLRERRGLALLLVSHDLAVVRLLADRVAVLRGGRIVEMGEAQALFAEPREPYTRQLLAAAAGLPRRARRD